MPLSRTLGTLLVAGALLAGGATLAAGLTGADAAKDRIDHMKALGGAAKAIGEQLKSGAPDPAVVKLNAAKVLESAKGLRGWFPAGSGHEVWAKSHALPAIWSDPKTFDEKAVALLAAAQKLDAAAQSGNMAAVGPAMMETGGACKACHEKFKAKDES